MLFSVLRIQIKIRIRIRLKDFAISYPDLDTTVPVPTQKTQQNIKTKQKLRRFNKLKNLKGKELQKASLPLLIFMIFG